MGPGGALSDPVVSAGRKPGSGRGRKLGIPLYGLSGIACALGWAVLLVLGSVLPAGGGASPPWLLAGAVACSLALLAAAPRLPLGSEQVLLRVAGAALAPAAPLGAAVGAAGPGALPVPWLLSGVGAGCLAALWMRHLAAFANQRQAMMALVGASALAAVIVAAGCCFRPRALAVLLALLPLLSVLISIPAAMRTRGREAALCAPAEEEPLSRPRFLVKELAPAFGCVALGMFALRLAQPLVGGEGACVAAAAGLALAALAMFLTLLALAQSVAFLLLGLVLPVTALCLPLALLGLPALTLAASSVLAFLYGCLLIVHLTNVARNAPRLFASHRRALDLACAVDGAGLLLGWAAFAAARQADLAFGGLVLLGLQAALVSLCLFTAAPRARHVPEVPEGRGGLLTLLMGVLRDVLGLGDAAAPAAEPISPPSAAPPPEGAAAGDGRQDACGRLAARHGLSPRETDVFAWLARGYNAQSIATRLCLSVNTVKTHIHSIYGKLDVHSQQELVAYLDEESGTGDEVTRSG